MSSVIILVIPYPSLLTAEGNPEKMNMCWERYSSKCMKLRGMIME